MLLFKYRAVRLNNVLARNRHLNEIVIFQSLDLVLGTEGLSF